MAIFTKIKKIEKIVNRPIERATIPTGKEVCEKQLFNHIDRIEHVDINREDIDDYLPVIFRKLEWMSREELITRMVALNFNRFLDYYKNAIDLNVDEKDEKRDRKERKKENANRDEGLKRLYFGLGKNDHVLPQKIIGKINDVTHTRDIRIGRIDLFDDYSFVDVEESYIPMILECFADPHNNPKGIVVEVAKEQPSKEEREKGGRGERKDRGSRGERKERSERSSRAEREEKPERKEREERREKSSEDNMWEKKSKKRKSDDEPKIKVERSRDGREWIPDDEWFAMKNHIDFFDDDDERPSRKKRNAERGFGAKKNSSKSSASSSSRPSKSSSRSASKESGRGRRGAARNNDDDFYSPRRRGGGRRR